jgi:hypothetical protein
MGTVPALCERVARPSPQPELAQSRAREQHLAFASVHTSSAPWRAISRTRSDWCAPGEVLAYNRGVADLTLQTLIEFRAEVREFRDENRKTLAQHGHRLNLLTEQMRDHSNRLAQLETHMAALLATMPHVHSRVDELAARRAKVEEKLASLS